jgi:hypothetical protein
MSIPYGCSFVRDLIPNMAVSSTLYHVDCSSGQGVDNIANTPHAPLRNFEDSLHCCYISIAFYFPSLTNLKDLVSYPEINNWSEETLNSAVNY